MAHVLNMYTRYMILRYFSEIPMPNAFEYLNNLFKTQSEYVPCLDQEIIVEYFKRGIKYKEICWKKGLKHCTTGPAEVVYYDNGRRYYESYYLENLLDRKSGPALIAYSENGTLIKESWYKENMLHNENGPAIITYNCDGQVVSQQFFVNNYKI